MFLIMIKKKIKDIIACCILLLSWSSFAQIGVGVETPEADLDVKGDIRMRQLGNPISFNHVILSDSEGNLAYLDQGVESYTVKEVLYKNMPRPVSSTAYSASIGAGTLVELGLEIVVELRPYTTNAVSIEYNVPISSTALPGYMGITLVRQENGTSSELEAGSRKFTYYNVPQNQDGYRYTLMPVAGKATDIITNDSSQMKYIAYSAKGYIERGAGTMNFGNPLLPADNFGTGILVIYVYEKNL